VARPRTLELARPRTIESVDRVDRAAHDPRARLLASGKALFARQGYEQTSTAAIAREAGTSESQLARYFGGKAGLLEAIFNENWRPLNQHLQQLVADATDARQAVLAIFVAFLSAFRRDPELAFLFLFEGRRLRGDQNEPPFSEGFREFADLFQRLIRRGRKDGTFAKDLDDVAVASALIGAVEGMMRECVLAEQTGRATPFSERAIRRVFEAVISGMVTGKRRRAEVWRG